MSNAGGDVLVVVGARPNFMKAAPLLRALDAAGVPRRLIHTEQHYDDALSRVFFEELELPAPDATLGVGSGSHAEQTARVMLAFERVLAAAPPRCVVVVGDVNSTVACALTAAKLGLPVAHVEAGLRSFDRAMPEELNRIVTDQLSELCLTPSADADENLRREGIPKTRIARVGNVMIDTLVRALPRARARRVPERFGLSPGGYVLATVHRPSNVDDRDALGRIVEILRGVAHVAPVVFPAHPRTRARLRELGLERVLLQGAPKGAVRMTEPLGYLDCVALQADARLVLTDSGGLQEETTWLGVPCLTLRDRTERPVTVTEGTNRVVGTDPRRVLGEALAILEASGFAGARGASGLDGRGEGGGGGSEGSEGSEGSASGAACPGDSGARRAPALWDGRSAERIVARLSERFGPWSTRGTAAGPPGAASPAARGTRSDSPHS